MTTASFTAPFLAALLAGATTAGDAIVGVLGGLTALMLPIGVLIILMSLGRGGPLMFAGRVAGNTMNVATGLASRQRPRSSGGPGRVLIVDHHPDQSRVAIARPLDIPIGSSVTVYGPRFAGYRHAWFIRVHELDNRALPARGVLLALASIPIGGLLTLLTLIAGIGATVG